MDEQEKKMKQGAYNGYKVELIKDSTYWDTKLHIDFHDEKTIDFDDPIY